LLQVILPVAKDEKQTQKKMKTYTTKITILTTTENAAIRYAILRAIEFNAKCHYNFFAHKEATALRDIYDLLNANTTITITATDDKGGY